MQLRILFNQNPQSETLGHSSEVKRWKKFAFVIDTREKIIEAPQGRKLTWSNENKIEQG